MLQHLGTDPGGTCCHREHLPYSSPGALRELAAIRYCVVIVPRRSVPDAGTAPRNRSPSGANAAADSFACTKSETATFRKIYTFIADQWESNAQARFVSGVFIGCVCSIPSLGNSQTSEVTEEYLNQLNPVAQNEARGCCSELLTGIAVRDRRKPVARGLPSR